MSNLGARTVFGRGRPRRLGRSGLLLIALRALLAGAFAVGGPVAAQAGAKLPPFGGARRHQPFA